MIYHPAKSKSKRKINRFLNFILVLLFMFFPFGIHMAPWWPSIGASNNGDSSIIYFILLPFIGITTGWFTNKNLMKAKFVLKDSL